MEIGLRAGLRGLHPGRALYGTNIAIVRKHVGGATAAYCELSCWSSLVWQWTSQWVAWSLRSPPPPRPWRPEGGVPFPSVGSRMCAEYSNADRGRLAQAKTARPVVPPIHPGVEGTARGRSGEALMGKAPRGALRSHALQENILGVLRGAVLQWLGAGPYRLARCRLSLPRFWVVPLGRGGGFW